MQHHPTSHPSIHPQPIRSSPHRAAQVWCAWALLSVCPWPSHPTVRARQKCAGDVQIGGGKVSAGEELAPAGCRMEMFPSARLGRAGDAASSSLCPALTQQCLSIPSHLGNSEPVHARKAGRNIQQINQPLQSIQPFLLEIQFHLKGS